MEKQLKYRDYLLLSSEEREKEVLSYIVSTKKLQLEMDILETKKAIDEAKAKRIAMLSSKCLCFKSLSSLDDEINSLNEGLKRANTYMKELFD